MSTRRVGRAAASALGVALAVGSACSMVGTGPRYLGVLGAADGVRFSLGIALLPRRPGQTPGPLWVRPARCAGIVLMNVCAFAGVITQVTPSMR